LGVEVKDVDVAAAQSQRRVALPFVGEAVHAAELYRAVLIDKMGEHAAAADRGELHRVSHHHYPPLPCIGQFSE
jgi:hypothetical protein